MKAHCPAGVVFQNSFTANEEIKEISTASPVKAGYLPFMASEERMHGKDPVMNQTGLMRGMVIDKINKEWNIEDDSYFDEERSDFQLAGALRMDHGVNMWENSHGREKSNDLISQKRRRIQSTGIPHNRNQGRRRTPDVDKGNYKASSPLIKKDNYMIERDLNLQMARMKLAEIAQKNKQRESVDSPVLSLRDKVLPLDTQITAGDVLDEHCVGSYHSPELISRNTVCSDIRYATKIESTKKIPRATLDPNLGQVSYMSVPSSRSFNKYKTTDLNIGENGIINNGENVTRFHSEKTDVNRSRTQRTYRQGTRKVGIFGIDEIDLSLSSGHQEAKITSLTISKDTGDQKSMQLSSEQQNEQELPVKNSFGKKVAVVNKNKANHGKTLNIDETLDGINVSIREESDSDSELSSPPGRRSLFIIEASVDTTEGYSPGKIDFSDQNAIRFLDRVQTQSPALNNPLKYPYKKADTSMSKVIPKSRVRAKKITAKFKQGSTKDPNVGV